MRRRGRSDNFEFIMHHRNSGHSDYFLLLLAGLVLVFGLFMLASASGPSGFKQFNDQYYFVKRQFFFGLLPGLFLFWIFSRTDYHLLKKNFWIFGGLTPLLLASVFIPKLGQNYGKAQSWIKIFSFSLQPAEFAKGAIIIFLAGWMAQFMDRGKTRLAWLPFTLFMIMVGALMMAEPDFGGFLIFCLIALTIYFLASTPLSHLGVLLLVGALAVGFLVTVAPYRVKRFTAFLNPERDALGISYQINQAKIAVGSGGIFGVGFGQSRQKLQYLPETSSDSIFAIISEELGFFSSAALVIVFLAIFWRIWKISEEAPDLFSKLMAASIGVWLVGQAYINIGGILSLMPLTGVPLPFISSGGSAMAASLAGLGLVNSISKYQE